MGLLARINVSILFAIGEWLNVPVPETFIGAGSRSKIGAWCKEHGYKRALIIMDKVVKETGIADKMLDSLNKVGVAYFIYDKVLPNPTVSMSKEAADIGKTNNVDVVIAIGGGSPIDCAKLTSAAITSKKTINNLIGILKVKQMPLPLIAIPTTAGTGSEVSAGAVISDDVTHMKSIMISPKIVPKLAVLDGETMTGLPKQWTAGTGFDALTHAVEAYIGFHYNADAKRNASEAVAAINKYLKRAYDNGSDIEARGALSLAAYKAGLAMNKCSLGYAHAFGHRLTGFYDLPHGMAVGMVLPHVINYNKKAAEKEFAELAVACDLGKDSEPKDVLADKFEKRIFELYDKLKLPKKCDKLKKSDYDQIVKEAFKETNATYGVPKYMTKKEAAELLDKILP